MAKYSPFEEKAGMCKVAKQQTDKSVSAVSGVLLELRFDGQVLGSERYITSKLGSLTAQQLERLKEAFAKCVHPRFKKEFAVSRHRPFGNTDDYRQCIHDAGLVKLARLVKLIGLLSQTKVYLFWINPQIASFMEYY